jgi:3-phosphoshikimate 1-carboxyvinyltransferase
MDNVTLTNISLAQHKGQIKGAITPPSSKSESNRVLVIHALAGKEGELQNLSNARDTQTMIRLLQNDNEETWDVLDAGTTMRFLTAYSAVSGKKRIMTGTMRMKERPILLLVDALRTLGADISYQEKDGYPPMLIKPFDPKQVKTNTLTIRGDVSSQYITALLMIAPLLPQGLKLELTGKIGSKPYIAMTLQLMQKFGVTAKWEGSSITVPHQNYKGTTYSVESDWSAASYWFSVAALAPEANFFIKGYKSDSLQGDRVITSIMEKMGVKSTFTNEGLHLEKITGFVAQPFEQDFTDCPDLAQTIAIVAAAKGQVVTMSGLESLRIKETDRIAAIQNELQKFGSDLEELVKDDTYKVVPGNFKMNNQHIATYKDHRMAMAFAPLALLGELSIENPEVVEKSYPHFWEDLKALGFEMK